MNSFPVVATLKEDLFWLMVWNSLRLWQLPYEAACSHPYGPGIRENRGRLNYKIQVPPHRIPPLPVSTASLHTSSSWDQVSSNK